MSVFSKLFSGPKGETEAASGKAAEEGPSMQRPPNDGRGAGAAQQPNVTAPKSAPAATKSTQRGLPAAQTPQSKSGTSAAQPASGSIKSAPAATPPASGPRVAPAAAASAASTPAVVVTRPIDVGGHPQATAARGSGSREGGDPGARPAPAAAGRPAMPTIQIGPPTVPGMPATNPTNATAARPPAPAAPAAPVETRNSVRPTAPE